MLQPRSDSRNEAQSQRVDKRVSGFGHLDSPGVVRGPVGARRNFFDGNRIDQLDITDPRRQHEANRPADALLVELHAVKDCLGIQSEVVRQLRRQLQRAQQGELPFRHRALDPTDPLGQAAGVNHADRHRLAVLQPAVTDECFVRVREGVAVVEQGAETGDFIFVLLDDVGLEPAASGDNAAEDVGRALVHVRGVRFEKGEKLRVEDHAVFDDFGQARAVIPIGQRGQRRRVDEHAQGLVERADQVLALRVVDADLSADRAVDVREQRRRNLHEGDAAGIRRRRETGRVADDPSAHGDDDRPPVSLQVDKRVVQPSDDRQRLGLLTRLEIDAAGLPAGPAQAFCRGLSIRGDVAVADDECFAARGGLLPAPLAPRFEELRPTVETRGGDHDVVTARTQRDRNSFGGCGRQT